MVVLKKNSAMPPLASAGVWTTMAESGLGLDHVVTLIWIAQNQVLCLSSKA